MIKLTEYEEHLKDEKELIYYWLYTNRISYQEITELYVATIEQEREYYKNTLSKSDVFVSTLIDNNIKEMNHQRPFAIEYMLNHNRMKGSKWFDRLKEKNK